MIVHEINVLKFSLFQLLYDFRRLGILCTSLMDNFYYAFSVLFDAWQLLVPINCGCMARAVYGFFKKIVYCRKKNDSVRVWNHLILIKDSVFSYYFTIWMFRFWATSVSQHHESHLFWRWLHWIFSLSAGSGFTTSPGLYTSNNSNPGNFTTQQVQPHVHRWTRTSTSNVRVQQRTDSLF